MIIHLTDKLRKKLKIDPLSRVEKETGAYLRWYANLFTINRFQYILVTNSSSLFSVVMHGRGISDINSFHSEFLSTLRDYLSELDMRMIFERVIAPDSGNITLSKTIDRSVLGSMKDMVDMNKISVEEYGKEYSPWDMARLINETPFRTINYDHPFKVFPNMTLV